jgi:hypothetical protein
MNESTKDLATGIIMVLFIFTIGLGIFGCFQLYALQKQITETEKNCPCLIGDVFQNMSYGGAIEICNGTVVGRCNSNQMGLPHLYKFNES